MKTVFKLMLLILAIVGFMPQAYNQATAIGNTIPLDSLAKKRDTTYVPVYLVPAGSRWDTVATIEFSYVGYNNQLFYDSGYVLQEVKLFTAGTNLVTEQGMQQVVNARGKKFYVDTAQVTGALATCACYIYNYKQPVPVTPKQPKKE